MALPTDFRTSFYQYYLKALNYGYDKEDKIINRRKTSILIPLIMIVIFYSLFLYLVICSNQIIAPLIFALFSFLMIVEVALNTQESIQTTFQMVRLDKQLTMSTTRRQIIIKTYHDCLIADTMLTGNSESDIYKLDEYILHFQKIYAIPKKDESYKANSIRFFLLIKLYDNIITLYYSIMYSRHITYQRIIDVLREIRINIISHQE